MQTRSGLVVIVRPPAIALHPTPPVEAPAGRAPTSTTLFERPAFFGGIRIQLLTKKKKQTKKFLYDTDLILLISTAVKIVLYSSNLVLD